MEESRKPQDNAGAVFSKEETLASVDGDRELLREIVGIFTTECESTVAAIRKAIDEQNASNLNRAAHTLKGMVGNFGARAAMEIALMLEIIGKNTDLAGAEGVLLTLQKELERLKKALVQFSEEA
jgi:HPt (histidine-containing phosphotransfer) domain-containing protein